MMKKPVKTFFIITATLAAAGAVALWYYTPIKDPVFAWLIAITAVTFLTYGYDKAVAGKDRTRVPERVLLGLAFIGGTVGAVIGMRLFRHKTVKSNFRMKFFAIALLQIIMICAYYLYLKPRYLQ